MLSSAIYLTYWNCKATWTVPHVLNYWSFNCKWMNFKFFITWVFFYYCSNVSSTIDPSTTISSSTIRFTGCEKYEPRSPYLYCSTTENWKLRWVESLNYHFLPKVRLNKLLVSFYFKPGLFYFFLCLFIFSWKLFIVQ